MKTIQILLVVYAALGVMASGAVDFTGKTFFRSQPIRGTSQSSFFDKPGADHFVNSDIFKDLRCEASGFSRVSRSAQKTGAYFGVDSTRNTVSIGAKEGAYDIFNQRILYYDPNVDSAPLERGTLVLNPKEIVQGIALTARKWLREFFCDLRVTIGRAEHSWNINVDNQGINLISNAGVLSFFQGGVSKDKQVGLLTGFLSDPIPTHGYELLDCVFTTGLDHELSDGTRIGAFAEVLFPVNTTRYENVLFYPVVGNIDHVGIGGGINGLVPLLRNKHFVVGCWTLAKFNYFFTRNEKRMPGINYKTPVGTATEPWAHYMLIKESTDTIYDPAVNVVSVQNVSVKPGIEGSLTMSIFAEGERASVTAGYRGWMRGEEKLSRPPDFTTELYQRIGTSGSFAIAPNLESCRVPAVSTHSAYAECSIFVSALAGSINFGASYEWAAGNAALDALMAWVGLNITF